MIGFSYANMRYIERTDRPGNVYGIDSIGYFQFNKRHQPIGLKWRDGHIRATIDLRINLNENTIEFVIVEGNSNQIKNNENTYFKASIPRNQTWVPCVMFYDKNQSAIAAKMKNDTFEQLHNAMMH